MSAAMPASSTLFVPLLRNAPRVLLLCLGIALVRTILVPSDWLQNLWVSLAIGLPSWLVIDAGRLWLSRDQATPWPCGWRGPALVLAGMCVGLLVGDGVLRLIAGQSLLKLSNWGSTLLLALLANGMSTWMFYLGGKARMLEMQKAAAERDAAEARLKLLESQLEPHMLFNTLANLRVLIATDPPQAQAMLDHLNCYLRATLGASRQPWHGLEQEFARLQDYLALMQVRMGPRLAYALELPTELAATPVPPLLLQPLVENAIHHGLEPQASAGHITVQARQLGEGSKARLQLQIIDNGLGLPADFAQPDTSARHFGLQQVRERLSTLYGEAATLELRAADAGGTCATITFPLKNP
ncbi:sensor histidine kinase [Comamonas sp. GB3 AK4-5]|uniref:sensor histidine kinase n=1 Tax=Comamonas sp. GB3 AK4-5 TaxID=3231487 RepID=UPI00351F243F